MVVPPTHTNMLNTLSSSSQSLGAQPKVNQYSWGYGYQWNKLLVVNMNYLWKLNPSDRTIALTKLLIKHANLHTKETEIGA